MTEENTPVVSVESEESETSVSADQQAEENKELRAIPTEYKSALKKAKTYSDMMHMSKAGENMIN